MMQENPGLLKELWLFIREKKAWWIAPVIFFLLLVGVLIVFSHSSAISPFVYALF